MTRHACACGARYERRDLALVCCTPAARATGGGES